jgi:hypothetical protein
MGCVGSTRRSALFTCRCLCFGCAPPVKWSSRVNQVHVGLDDCMRDGEGTRGMDVLTFAVKLIGARLQVARWASCRVGCSMPKAGHCMSSVDGVETGRRVYAMGTAGDGGWDHLLHNVEACLGADS